MHKYLVEFASSLFMITVIFTTKNAIAIGAAMALVYFLLDRTAGNPAVTFAVALQKNQLYSAETYFVFLAQIMGAIAAVLLLK